MKGFVCFLLCLATVFGLFTGCVRQVEPTQPVTTTEETTLAPTTEPTEETTVFVPLPLELDTPAPCRTTMRSASTPSRSRTTLHI